MVYKCINNQAPEYLKCMLLSQNTDCDKRTRQDYDRTSLRISPVEKLRYKCSHVKEKLTKFGQDDKTVLILDICAAHPREVKLVSTDGKVITKFTSKSYLVNSADE